MGINVDIGYLNNLMRECVSHGGKLDETFYSNHVGVRDALAELARHSSVVYAFDYRGMPLILRPCREGEIPGEARSYAT